jgi:hypothetical protein
MKGLILFTFLFCSLSINCYVNGQETYLTESNTHIFWQTERELKQDDFKGNGLSNPKSVYYCDSFKLCTVASVGLFAILDIPKKKSRRGELIEKAYFAPAFEKATSYILNDDTLGIRNQKMVFDIYEAAARFARKQLSQLQDTIKAYGVISLMFKSVEARAVELRDTLVDSFTIDVCINNRLGSYEEWRKNINDLLNETNDFATKPEDCYRFIKSEPIDDDYIVAKKVTGDIEK